MKKNILLGFLIITFLGLQAQVAPNKYYVQFTDKNNSPYSINHPEAFLTARAIARRQAYNIPIVENDLPVNPQYLQGVAATGAQLLNPTRWLNGVTIYTTDSTVLAAVQALPYVDHTVLASYGKPGKKSFFEKESFSEDIPDTYKNDRNTATYNYGLAYNQIHQINGTGLHDMGYRGQGMVIAVLDAGYIGVDTHPVFDSLWANNQILGTKNFVTPGDQVFTQFWHGREVLSCMGADDPGLMIGTAPKASYWLLLSEDISSENVIEEYNWVSAAEFADSVGADVINSSLGYIAFDNPAFSHPYSDMDGNTCISTIGADIAASKGILVTNSAGNSGNNQTFPWIGAPADGDSVFTIGAVDGNGNRAVFSSQGPTYDGRIKPTVMAQGQGTAVANDTNGVSFGNGTSFSSPVMAGMSACLWQAYPDKNNMDIMDAIKQSASMHSSPDNYMGWGIPDFMEAYSLITSVERKIQSNRLVLVYPNPFGDYLHIEFLQKSDSIYTLEIHNVLGTLLVKRTLRITGRYRIQNISGLFNRLSVGVYFLKVTSKDRSQTVKLVKE